MIRLGYALTLARTKLNSKKATLLTSIIVASILFAVLIAGVIMFTGAQKSAVSFLEKANNNSYLVDVTPVLPEDIYIGGQIESLEELNELKQREKEYYDEVRANYKAQGIAYDASQEVSVLKPSPYFEENTPEALRFISNFQSPVVEYAQTKRMEAYVAKAKNTRASLKEVAAKYGGSGFYSNFYVGATVPQVTLIHENKEDFTAKMKSDPPTSHGYFINAIHNNAYGIYDDELLGRYLLPQGKPLEGVPVIVSAQEAAKLFGKEKGIGEEPKEAQPKATWLKEVQGKLNGYVYQSCERNSADRALLDKINNDYVEMKTNEGKKDYIKPSLLYNLPTEPCGAVSVKSDTRSVAEKKFEQDTIDKQKKLGTYVAPARTLHSFQIVGIVNSEDYLQAQDVQSFLKTLLSVNNLTSNAFIPRAQYESLPKSLKIDGLIGKDQQELMNNPEKLDQSLQQQVVSFKTIGEARAFMDNETCTGDNWDCKRLFKANPHGSNYVLLEDIGAMFQKVMSYALPIVLGFAAIIIWFTMGRVMAENRKETAVYRAMGARRKDILAVYLTYGGIIALYIALLSVAIGVVAAFIIDLTYGAYITSIATASFGTITEGTRFSLFSIESPYLLMIIGAIFVVSYIAMIQPLIRNIMRSPIKDMRSE